MSTTESIASYREELDKADEEIRSLKFNVEMLEGALNVDERGELKRLKESVEYRAEAHKRETRALNNKILQLRNELDLSVALRRELEGALAWSSVDAHSSSGRLA